jgi:hypothetical protein
MRRGGVVPAHWVIASSSSRIQHVIVVFAVR